LDEQITIGKRDEEPRECSGAANDSCFPVGTDARHRR